MVKFLAFIKEKFLMIKHSRFIFFLLIVFLFLFPAPGFSGGKISSCDTKFPIILAHGTGGAAEILGIIDYFWGIPEALESEGAEVYVTTVNGMDGTIDKAHAFKEEFLKIKAVVYGDTEDDTKFNIIGHSHGALYTRYAVSNLGLAPDVASLTCIAGPHKGMVLADIIVGVTPAKLKWLTGNTLNLVYAYIFGDTNPDSLQNAYDVTRSHMQNIFNPGTPDMANVYYQSWAAKVKFGCPNIILDPSWKIISIHEGDNDGLVSVESAQWGSFRWAEEAAWWSPGCDHLNIIGHLFGITPGFDAPEFYQNIVSELKEKGF